jgi:galactose mutarotase-like enzyme
MVVLPQALAATLTAPELRDVLIHECAHVLRRDTLVGVLPRLAAALYWPHPLVHHMNSQLARAREEVCDNFVLRSGGGALALAARVEEPQSGRVLEIWTDQPGIQLYTGNFLDGTIVGKGGKTYGKHFAFCLETQHFPDSPNHASFPTTILEPGQIYRTVTVHKFLVK